ncbi:Uncharacterised protein [Streptococcus pneumoniae]|nr:Uncharacterised protein [Streptococcus pneumoniae]VKK47563.1 Uncharacterised protein [Streptococcus pneumoniae]VKP59091.1 Uncharacterised protein [Streptococcus pneumoniae]VKU62747.1 Uncharacterised protein [Streptococcus pneumoniae]VLD59232.1 Uncharacterised protein [Streptococcus pneumoniae]
MNTLKTEQYQEARDRLDTLDSVFTLSPSLINQWENGKLCYSYLTPADNHLINLLYVSKAEKGISKAKQAKIWQKEFNNNIFGWVNACVINPNNPTSYVHEDIFIGTCQGILGRIK